MKSFVFLLLVLFGVPCFGQYPLADLNAGRYHRDSLQNPFGAGSRFKTDGLFNPYSKYGSRFSNESWRNPYATRPPKIYSSRGYHGEFSANRWRRDSISNKYGRFGSPYSPQSVRNPWGAGNPYYSKPIWIYPAM